MLLRLTNLRLPVETPDSALAREVAKRLQFTADETASVKILRKSLDARNRDRLEFVYSLILDVPDARANSIRSREGVTVEPWSPEPFDDPAPGSTPLSLRPVIVGSGPAGLLAGYLLAMKGYRPIIIERGQAVKERVPAIREFDSGGAHDPDNNYLFGEGGAGCFSDGKLTCRITGPDVDWVLQSFVDCGGRASLVYEHRPHLGSNKLPLICRNYRRRIEALGGEYRFGCRLEGFTFADGRLTGLQTSSGFLPTSVCVLAIGHSARDTYEMLLASGLPLRPKAFQLGLRIEQPQSCVNERKYGRPDYLSLLGAADYSLVARNSRGRSAVGDARDLFSFCMCAGGIVIPSVSEPNMYCSNGMSNSRHDSTFANSGLVATLDPSEFGSDHPLAGVRVQQHFESLAFRLTGGDYQAPVQRARDFLAGRTPSSSEALPSSYERGTQARNLAMVLPAPILRALQKGLPEMDRQWRGDYLTDAVLVGPEMRGSSPVRIDRDPKSMEIPELPGIYPIGEGAGYAGGIVTAAVDGLRAARQIVMKYRTPEE